MLLGSFSVYILSTWLQFISKGLVSSVKISLAPTHNVRRMQKDIYVYNIQLLYALIATENKLLLNTAQKTECS